MKMRQIILLAMSAVVGVFGTSRVFAASVDTEVGTNVRIESITKVVTDGGPNLPLSPETTSTVYFDVKLMDISGSTLTFVGNSYNAALSNNNNRPYLVLDIPLSGMSTKVEWDTAAGEAQTVQTSSAVAYYVGQGATPDTLRFAYVVRPGDMTEELTWACKTSGTLAGAPQFGGSLAAIQLSVRVNGAPQAQNTGVVEGILCGSTTIAVPEDPQVWAVNGYNITIGALTDTTDLNSGMLYQGLVPVTVSTKGSAAASYFTNQTYSKNCYFWVEYEASPDNWVDAPAAVTYMRTDSTQIMEAAYNGDTKTYAKFVGSSDSSATAFTSQTFFVNIPVTTTVPAGTMMRLCYGVKDVAGAEKLYTYIETPLVASPLLDDNRTSGYTVTCGEMSTAEFTLPATGLTYTELQNLGTDENSRGTINIAAGESITLTIAKNNANLLTNAGTLYADIELISTTNAAMASFSRYYIPLDPSDLSGGHAVKMTLGANATGGETYYRIRVPQLEEANGNVVDKPFYLKVVSSKKRETITLTPGETGTSGTEHYQPLDVNTDVPGSATFLEYKLTVPAADTTRYFTIFPVAADMETQILADATFANGGHNVYEALKQYVVLQSTPGTIIKRDKYPLTVRVGAGETSATFYAACVNDYPYTSNILSGDIVNGGKTIAISGANFIARSSNSEGTITGMNDVCNGMVAPVVNNRAPMIRSSSPPTSGGTGTELPFVFTVTDVLGDYLIARMDYGDGTIDTHIYYHKASMEAIMGATGWETELKKLMNLYGITEENRATQVFERTDLGVVTIQFRHAYTTSSPSWNFSITDSSLAASDMTGTLTLPSAQQFIFHTIADNTVPASGYIRWAEDTTDITGEKFSWSFGDSYTSNSKVKTEGATTAMVKAVPFAAGARPNKGGYTNDVDRDQDSFFYQWAAYSDDYATLLPTDNNLYSDVLTINRAFVVGGGEADDFSKWHDIVLRAIFVAEWRPSDALEPFTKSRNAPYLYELGDYNQDGVPDGWLLNNLGSEAGRPLVEGGSVADAAPEGDSIPAAGWANGEAAYRWQPAGTRLDYNTIAGPGPAAHGSAFGYRTRLRGRDNNLNAADGNGNWLSIPIWEVLVHPMYNDEGVWYAQVANAEGEDFLWTKISLYDGMNPAVVPLAFTAMGIPYQETNIVDGWAKVIDAGGKPMNAAVDGEYLNKYTVEVQTDPESEDYETFRYTPVNGWGYLNDEIWTLAGTADDLPTKFTAGGMRLDEAFNGDDPRFFSWLNRFAPNNADVDGDGVCNGIEYYFWYFASRMAWAPTITDADGNVTIVKDAWPLVDPRKIANPNTDENCGTTEVFVMGRRYRNNYDPDAATASFHAEEGGAGNATAGKGNYWEPITVGAVLAHFNPYTFSVAGDIDNDGLSTVEEIAAGTNPLDCDTDDDWIPDGWEDAFELDPLNLGGNNDAELNPDRDFYATTELELYPDYHHLFRAEAVIIRTLDTDTDTIVEEQVAYEEGVNGIPLYYYYDAIDKVFYKIGGEVDVIEAINPEDPPTYENQRPLDNSEIDGGFLNEQSLVEIEEIATEADPETKVASIEVVAWATTGTGAGTEGEAAFVQMEPETVRLRDFEVYKALGFDCRRAWSGDQNDPCTQPFNSREEFNSAVARAEAGASVYEIIGVSTNPQKADTNDDGIPDGWAAYVGFNPLDTVIAGRDLDEDGLSSAEEYAMGADGWTNKTHPTDPRNPDTDFDTVSDGGERAYLANGGMNPTMIDTDSDGIPDGWEHLYGKGQTDDRGRPNPTVASDTSLDYDRDGLTNYQEYLVGLLRHLRYDLGPDAARLYKDDLGTVYKATEAAYAWENTPDVYSVMEDLVNPTVVDSIDYKTSVPVLAQAWAASNGLLAADYSGALTVAFNRLWNSTIIFPTAEQLASYGLYATEDDKGINADKVGEMNALLDELPLAVVEFDAAYHRLLAANGNDVKINLADRQIRALMTRIDTMLETLEEAADEDGAAIRKPILNLLKSGEVRTLWTERKKQVAATLVDLDKLEDAIYAADELNLPRHPYASMGDLVGNYEPAAYEKAVYATTSSLLRTTYRAAVRGFNGGLQEEAYFGPLAQHAPVKPFAETWDQASGEVTGGRSEDGAPLLGIPMAEDDLGALAMPIQGGRDEGVYFPTTNPLVADSDADGMDDYWEVFHGLNPILGDTVNDSSSAGDGGANYVDDVIQLAYAKFELTPTGETNYIFNPPELDKRGNVTGYDYYTYPWLAGAPYADPDGDGLLNFEEAVNPVASEPAHYGTDPSALWMTDKDNPNSFTARFYGRVNSALKVAEVSSAVTMDDLAGIMPGNSFVYKTIPGEVEPELDFGGFVLPFEINEGYDTDGDGVSDLTELTNTTIYRGNPQALRTPDRQQAAYFGGSGALQSFGETQFGPTALTTFTLECWVKPDADQETDEVVLIDRPWRFTDDSDYEDSDANNVRHNFILGLRKSGADFVPFVNYTGAGTTSTGGTATAPQVAPTVISGETIKAGEWNHLAATYDGKRLTIVLNGVETGAATCSLIPANGVIALKNDGSEDYRRFTYRKAPIIIGATPGSKWFAELGKTNNNPFKGLLGYYTNCYKGFIDEVRIWNGARTASQIADNRRKTFTQAELLDFRYKAFMARYEGQGFYEANTPTEPLAIYTFNDLLAGELLPEDDSDPNNVKPAVAADAPWERYPGEKLVGDDTVPGSFTYRRKGLLESIDGELENAYIKAALPDVTEVFSSYYTTQVSNKLRSTHYCEGVDADGNPYSEFVPMAHNIVAHLPVADVERDVDADEDIESLLKPTNQDEGSPELRFPSGSAENLKVLDSVYWTPYATGYQVNETPVYSVKVDGNPYAYYYGATYTFDMLNYRTHPGYTFRTGTDLLIYGDVFAKYDKESWDNAPTTDPSPGQDDDGTGTIAGEPEGSNWFEYETTIKGDATNDDYLFTDIQLSQGGNWLDKNIAVGQTKDVDGDRMPNWWENYYGLDPEDATGENGPHGDVDGDYLTNYAEYLAKSSPNKYSTAGNGVPDSQTPIWFRRGRPTMALLYTDNDMMEDHWEAENRSDRLSVDLNDAYGDADGDGWSNFAEARAGFRGSTHSTDPNTATSIAQNGTTVLEMPTPALRLTVDYFGDQNVYTNALEDAQIVVHAYTAKNNNSAPDAIFKLPLATTANTEEAQSYTQDVGYWRRGVISGYLHIGNIIPGSLKFRYARYMADGDDTVGEDIELLYHDIIADTSLTNGEALLYYNYEYEETNEETGEVTTRVVRYVTGKVNYSTGYYEIDFTLDFWPDYWQYTADDGTVTYYENSEHAGTAYYESSVTPGSSCTFTLAKPASGHLKEGKNNFFVFADLNSNGSWEETEPAGIPDQHDVEIGHDLVNRPLHVALSSIAPPGAVRLDVKSILDRVMTPLVIESEDEGEDSSSSFLAASGDGDDSDENLSSVINPTTGDYLNRDNFSALLDYELILTQYTSIANGSENILPSTVVYRKQYNSKKPYLTEDEIFSYSESGLPGTSAPAVKATTYKVYYIPTTLSNLGVDSWEEYNIAIVTNKMEQLDESSTKIVSPIGGEIRHNTDLAFEWLCNVQVPTFTLTITKTADGSGKAMNRKVYEKTARGVTPIATAPGNGSIEQYRYRYMLPRGIGEISADKSMVFGNGSYEYTLSLNPYNGSPVQLTGNFSLQLVSSGDKTMSELPNTMQDTSFNAQDSHYVRTRIRYNGVLAKDEDFDQRRIVIEAHYSGSFNGDPIASTSDFLVYDAVNEDGTFADDLKGDARPDFYTNLRNRCVRMVKDKVSTKEMEIPNPADPTMTIKETKEVFFSTRFDAELRGFATNAPVYLIAYFDLNGNGKRDNWEPWGYATQGLDALNGFYFDPRAVVPVSSGTEYLTEFYIQDVDTDSDKLADSWEWLQSGKPTTEFDEWCGNLGTTLANHQGCDIWVATDANYGGGAWLSEGTTYGLTAYGAQLYGLTVTGAPDANGAVPVEGLPADTALAAELYSIIGPDAAQLLFSKDYLSYGLSISNIVFDGENVKLTWDVTSAVSVESGVTYDITSIFTNNATDAVYAIYGKTSIADTVWTKVGAVKVANGNEISIAAPTITVDGEAVPVRFFKVILSAKTPSATIED